MAAPSESFIFWQHDVNQTIPNDVWTPLALNLNRASRPNRRTWTDNKFNNSATTIAAGSDAAALPQATINVADTTGGGDPKLAFTTSGYLVIRIGGTDRLVKYTGKTATTFTGCTLGVGTMNTGNQVRQACVEFKPPFPALVAATFEVAWASNATGIRGIRLNANQLGITASNTTIGAVAATPNLLHVQATEQPAFGIGALPNFVEVYQNSTASLDSVVGAVDLGAPRLVACTLTTYTTEPIA